MSTATLTAPTATPPTTPPTATAPVALGTLLIHHSRRRPRMLVVITCPLCAREHVHSWTATEGETEPQPRVAHCARATPQMQYLVGPADTPHNRAQLVEYAALARAADALETAPSAVSEGPRREMRAG